MPRPVKRRRVCQMPEMTKFSPNGVRKSNNQEKIILSIDEFEALRLIDYEGLSQEECSLRMNVARTTVQSIYNNARKKLIKMLVEGIPLDIVGGNYALCDDLVDRCNGCGRRRRMKFKEMNNENTNSNQ